MSIQGTLSARHNTGNELIHIRKNALPEPCDAVYCVSGNGMAPIIRDGDLILVAFDKHLEPGGNWRISLQRTDCSSTVLSGGVARFQAGLGICASAGGDGVCRSWAVRRCNY